MTGLTQRQAAVLAFIEAYIANNGCSPSHSEIQAHFNFSSPNAVSKHLAALKRRGIIQNEPHLSRSISIIPKSKASSIPTERLLPLKGEIRGGHPIYSYSQVQPIAVPLGLVRSGEGSYLLLVNGDELHEEMLLDGDLLIVDSRAAPQPGETIIVSVNGDNTLVGSYYIEGHFLKLVSRTPHHQPILLKQQGVVFHGVILAMIRRYSGFDNEVH